MAFWLYVIDPWWDIDSHRKELVYLNLDHFYKTDHLRRILFRTTFVWCENDFEKIIVIFEWSKKNCFFFYKKIVFPLVKNIQGTSTNNYNKCCFYESSERQGWAVLPFGSLRLLITKLMQLLCKYTWCSELRMILQFCGLNLIFSTSYYFTTIKHSSIAKELKLIVWYCNWILGIAYIYLNERKC